MAFFVAQRSHLPLGDHVKAVAAVSRREYDVSGIVVFLVAVPLRGPERSELARKPCVDVDFCLFILFAGCEFSQVPPFFPAFCFFQPIVIGVGLVTTDKIMAMG